MYTPEFFRRTTRCHPLGGDANDVHLTYLPQINNPLGRLKGSGWEKVFPPEIARYANTSPIPAHLLEGVYAKYLTLHGGNEPDWMEKLTPNQRRTFRFNSAIEEADLHYALPRMPYTGLGYFIEDGGFIAKVCRALNVDRLRGVGQLGRLQYPADGSFMYGQFFEHNRLSHSLDVLAIALIIALNNRLDPVLTRILETAAAGHDAMTCAYGDGAKPIDPALYDEDANFWKLLRRKAWKRLRKEYGIDEQILIDTVQGKGVLGTILDISDKLSYLSRDVDAFVRHFNPNLPYDGHREILELLAKRRYPLGMWGSVRIRDGKVFVKDAAWLGDVLKIRALMFKHLYFNPHARYLERMSGVIFAQHLIETGKLAKSTLLKLTDQELDRVIERRFGLETNPILLGQYEMTPNIRLCGSLEEAKRLELELLLPGPCITFIDSHPHGKSGTHLLVKKGRTVLPFAEACPEDAAEIDGIMNSSPTVTLFHLPVDYKTLPAPLKTLARVNRKKVFAENGYHN